MAKFGDFSVQCRQIPSYPWCNLFYRQIADISNTFFTSASADPKSAPVGVNPDCGILKAGSDGSLGNIANMIVCGLSMVFVLALIMFSGRRKAAVGRVEIRIFLILYFLTLPFQFLSTGAVLEQGTKALVILTAIHAGLVAALFWGLVANALVATQVVEDGTVSSLVPFYFFTVAFFVATLYISLDVALHITDVFGPSNPLSGLHSTPLFILTSIWPGAAALIYFGLMTYIVLAILNEVRPMWYYIISGILFILSQLDYFLLNKVICNGANAKVDGSFVATILETASVGVLYLAWRSITEESWDDDYYVS
ncbi:hypothetical protein PILCRDRAFT_582570 [Piloderma croceum F 1598]|uniref:Uncharacterized protein n=1 Tax=Piloderma croceum (strain F 1598) TaxID=765440 RepID=A0A0C3FFX7_PILCF|nr:hypothetical protein PILCRDRAFT_582570 [Piloderma croceum F 1598]